MNEHEQAILDLLTPIYRIVEEENIDLSDYYIHDDIDLILFCLRYTLNHWDEAFS